MLFSISVIIPTYNRSHCLERALNSVMEQRIAPMDIILVDDGSEDDTAKRIQAKFPGINYIAQPNQGVSKARNVGIQQAQGEWIALLDSDDAWLPKKLEKQKQALLREPNFKICHTDEIWYRHGKRVNPMDKHQKKGGWIFQHCLPACAISPSSVLMHKSLFTELGLFDETLPACEDYDLWLRVTSMYPVLYLGDKLTVKYGGHGDQLSKKYWGMDRFRIKALQRIINSDKLSATDYDAAINMLREKIVIYIKGASKRGKSQEVDYYENLLKQYETVRQA